MVRFASMPTQPDWPALLPEVALDHLAPVAERATGDALELARQALDEAGLGAFLAQAAARGGPLTVVVNDPHRFTDTRSFVEVLVTALERASLSARALPLRVLVAAGSHRSTADERARHEARILGPHAARFAEIAWHDARDGATHRTIGATTLHRWMTEGGHYLACGSVEPHYFAGATGAHKTLTVGVMALATLTDNHHHAMSSAVAPLKLRGNPIHEGVLQALGDLEATGARLLALNQVVIDGTVVACSAGHPVAALERALPIVERSFGKRLAHPMDLVIARVRPPLDRDLYQAEKGIKNTETGVRDGGVIVLEAACEHGVGLDQFVELLRAAPRHSDALATVAARGYRLGDHKAVRLRALTDTRAVQVALVTRGIDAGLAAVLGMTIFSDRASAADWVSRRLAPAARGALVEDAGNVVLLAP